MKNERVELSARDPPGVLRRVLPHKRSTRSLEQCYGEAPKDGFQNTATFTFRRRDAQSSSTTAVVVFSLFTSMVAFLSAIAIILNLIGFELNRETMRSASEHLTLFADQPFGSAVLQRQVERVPRRELSAGPTTEEEVIKQQKRAREKLKRFSKKPDVSDHNRGPAGYERFKAGSRAYRNAKGVHKDPRRRKFHGDLGATPEESVVWKKRATPPLPIENPSVDARAELAKGKGFYVSLSDSIPLDREPPDARSEECKDIRYDYEKLANDFDASIIITIREEPLSLLLRTIHSVLNYTVPAILHEILIFNDGNAATEELQLLQNFVKNVPKVKIISRTSGGVSVARSRASKAAKGSVLVFVDPHIEVNEEWLEPLLETISQEGRLLVFPAIHKLRASTDFGYSLNEGIGYMEV